MTWFDVYLFTRLDAIHGFFQGLMVVIGIFSGAAMLTLLLIGFIEECDELKHIGIRVAKYTIPAFFFCVFMYGLIPTTKEFAAIYLIPKIANNEQVQQIPENALKLLNAKFEEWLKDATGENKK